MVLVMVLMGLVYLGVVYMNNDSLFMLLSTIIPPIVTFVLGLLIKSPINHDK